MLDALGQPEAWSLGDRELEETITELVTGLPRLQGHLMTLLAQADSADLASRSGAVNTAAWLRGRTRATGAEATGLVRTARTLEAHQPVRDALLAGEVLLDQATTITTAVDALPAEVHHRRDQAEAHLLAEAREHDAKALRRLGKYLLEVIAPDEADELIARHWSGRRPRPARPAT